MNSVALLAQVWFEGLGKKLELLLAGGREVEQAAKPQR